jgi:anti-anti-sigma factor
VTGTQNAEIIAVPGADRVRLRIRGELDLASAPTLDDAVAALGSSPPSLILLDLAEMTFFDSSGLRVLMRVAGRCRDFGATVRLLNLPAQARRVMELTGTLDRFDVGEDPNDG